MEDLTVSALILIVDDHRDNLYFLETMLKGYGFEVISAENGRDALDKAHLNPPDVIVTDILMPVMDGYDLCRQWKSDDKLKHIPLVFYTATYTDPRDETFALSLGADRFILKPQEPDIFMNMLKEVLGEEYTARQVVTKPLGEEMEFFKQYNEILFKKLEKKVTDLQIANQNSKILEDKYRSQFEHLQDAILLTKPDGSIIEANKAACVMFGRSADEIRAVGRNALVDVTDPRLQTALEERIQAGEVHAEITMLRANGEKFPADVTSTIFTDMNGQQKTSLIIRDITERKRAEDILRKSEARFRSYFELPLIGISITSPEKGWIEVNNRLSDILGYSVQELKGMSWSELTYPEDLDADVEQFNRVLAGEIDSYVIDKRFVRKDGEIIWISLAAGCVRKQDGSVDYFVALLEDISVRKRAEEALRENEEKYRTILEDMDDVYFEVDIKGNITFVNRSTSKMSGYSKEELIGMSFKKISVPDVIELVMQYFGEIFQTGKTGKPFVWSLKKRNGEQGFFEIVASLIRDKQGQPVGFKGIGRDITERRQTEAKLQQTLDSLRKAVGATIQVLVSAVEARDPYTAGHQSRVAHLACAIAEDMGLTQDKVEGIRLAGSIHDIGKLSVPAEILTRPSKLTNIEFSMIKEHSQNGYEMLKHVESSWPLAEIVYQHHERINGSGYPRNLKGDEIIIEARIMAVADVVEAMASHRPYRPSLGIDSALEEIENNKGILYEAAVANACLKLFREKGYNLP
jgi:PAS domain S-box-containing protein/putative nucleotidyltransferase with HDIG domain